MTFFALGTYLPMVIMSGYVDDMSTSNGVSAEYLTELHSFMNGTMIVIIAIVTFVAGIIGALIAKGVFKSIFKKPVSYKNLLPQCFITFWYFRAIFAPETKLWSRSPIQNLIE